jgi:hypothetical protein
MADMRDRNFDDEGNVGEGSLSRYGARRRRQPSPKEFREEGEEGGGSMSRRRRSVNNVSHPAIRNLFSLLFVYLCSYRPVMQDRPSPTTRDSYGSTFHLSVGTSSTTSRTLIRHSLGSYSHYVDEISSVISCGCDRHRDAEDGDEDETRIGDQTDRRLSSRGRVQRALLEVQ